MLKIRASQLDAIRQSVRDRYVGNMATEIENRMRSNVPEVTNAYGESLRNNIAEAVGAAERYGIHGQDQVYDWCVVRVISRQPFYDMKEFSDILDHPFLTPYAKARHIILSFFQILALQRERH